MDTTRAATAAKVERAREDAGLSRLALSVETGIPRSTLNRMLDGKQSFSVEHIDLIAAALAVEPGALLEFRVRAA